MNHTEYVRETKNLHFYATIVAQKLLRKKYNQDSLDKVKRQV